MESNILNIGTMICDSIDSLKKQLSNLSTVKEDEGIIKPYSDLNNWIYHEFGCDDWKYDEDIDKYIFNEKQYNEILNELNRYGVNLIGAAGVGKSFVSRLIGYSVVNKSNYNNDGSGYKGFYELIFNSGVDSTYVLTYGEDIFGKEHEGAIISAMRLASEMKDYAFVIRLEEITRFDVVTYMSKVYSLLGDGKNDGEYVQKIHGDEIYYPKNLYIICTSNTSEGSTTSNNIVSINDDAFNHRFTPYKMSSIFESPVVYNKFKCYLSQLDDVNSLARDLMIKKLDGLFDIIPDLLEHNKSKSNRLSSADSIRLITKALGIDKSISDIKEINKLLISSRYCNSLNNDELVSIFKSGGMNNEDE